MIVVLRNSTLQQDRIIIDNLARFCERTIDFDDVGVGHLRGDDTPGILVLDHECQNVVDTVRLADLNGWHVVAPIDWIDVLESFPGAFVVDLNEVDVEDACGLVEQAVEIA